MISGMCESVYMVCIRACVYMWESKAWGSNKCVCLHMHVSCVLFKRVSLDLSLERLVSAKYHSTCSLVCACVCVCCMWFTRHNTLGNQHYAVHQLAICWDQEEERQLTDFWSWASLSSPKAETHCTLEAAQADRSSAQTVIQQSAGVKKGFQER